LAVVPSVVFGLWGVLVRAEPIGDFYTSVASALSPIRLLGNLFDEPASGRSFFTAGLILAIMIIPIITSLTREVFDTTPTAEKEAAFGLGATRWEMIRASVFAHSKGGMVGAVTLGLGRAMGETIVPEHAGDRADGHGPPHRPHPVGLRAVHRDPKRLVGRDHLGLVHRRHPARAPNRAGHGTGGRRHHSHHWAGHADGGAARHP